MLGRQAVVLPVLVYTLRGADTRAVSMLSRRTFLHRKLHNITQGKRPTECGTGRRRSSATARNRLGDGALVVSTRQADCQTSRRLLALTFAAWEASGTWPSDKSAPYLFSIMRKRRCLSVEPHAPEPCEGLGVGQGDDAGEGLALEQFERGAAARRHERHLPLYVANVDMRCEMMAACACARAPTRGGQGGGEGERVSERGTNTASGTYHTEGADLILGFVLGTASGSVASPDDCKHALHTCRTCVSRVHRRQVISRTHTPSLLSPYYTPCVSESRMTVAPMVSDGYGYADTRPSGYGDTCAEV